MTVQAQVNGTQGRMGVEAITNDGELMLAGSAGRNADFEIYDERAADPLNTVLDLYIGIK